MYYCLLQHKALSDKPLLLMPLYDALCNGKLAVFACSLKEEGERRNEYSICMAKKRSKPNPVILWLLGLLVPAYVRLVQYTTRWEIVGRNHYDVARTPDQGMIIAFWHSRIMMMIALRKQFPGKFNFMISGHRDGVMIAKAVKAFNIEVAHGSAANPRKQEKNKSGSNALRTLGAGITARGGRWS